MIQITHILCPVDFSDFSRRALDHAAAMARWYGATLTVLYVFPNLPAMDMPPVVLEEADRQRILGELRRFAAVVPPDVAVTLRVQEGSHVHREILEQAGALHADLVVLGSHGRSGFERFLLGSVAEKVVRSAPCPTMVVPPQAPDRATTAPVEFHSILCAVDFSEVSIRALRYALSVAEENDARLRVLHVIEIPPELRENPLAEGFDVDRVRAAAEAECLERLRSLIPDEAQTYCSVETAVCEGAAHRQVLSVAAEQQADLIVMGVRGRGAVELLVYGSNTARVARAATCPVLIVPGA